MSYGIHAYAIDFEALTAALGSGDEVLLRRLQEDHRDELSSLDQLFDDDIAEGAPSVGDALRLLIKGGATPSQPDNAQYGYALELICRSLGEALYPDSLTQLSISWLSAQPALNELGAGAGVLRPLLPLPLDFPGVGCIAPDDVMEKVAEARAAASASLDPDTEDCYAEYLRWLDRALLGRRALLSFLY